MSSSTSRPKTDPTDRAAAQSPQRPERRADDTVEIFAVDSWEPSLLARMRKAMRGRRKD